MGEPQDQGAFVHPYTRVPPWNEDGCGPLRERGRGTLGRQADLAVHLLRSLRQTATRHDLRRVVRQRSIANVLLPPVGAGGSIFVSHDYGATFTKNVFTSAASAAASRSIVPDPFDEDVLYSPPGIACSRSRDRGATWEPGGEANSFWGFNQIVADPVRPGRNVRRGIWSVSFGRRRSNLARLLRRPAEHRGRAARHHARRHAALRRHAPEPASSLESRPGATGAMPPRSNAPLPGRQAATPSTSSPAAGASPRPRRAPPALSAIDPATSASPSSPATPICRRSSSRCSATARSASTAAPVFYSSLTTLPYRPDRHGRADRRDTDVPQQFRSSAVRSRGRRVRAGWRPTAPVRRAGAAARKPRCRF